MNKIYRPEASKPTSARHPRPMPEAGPDLDMIDYLDELELDRREAVMEFNGVQPTLSVDAYLH